LAEYILGIDIGTSACKTAVFDKSGNIIATKTGAYKVYYPQEGFVEQNPLEWWTVMCGTVKNMLSENSINPSDIKSVGIDGQSWSAIMIDKNGEIIFDNPIWMDTRAAEICEEIKQSIGEKAIFDVCGNPFSPTYTLPKLIWFKRHYPETYNKAYKVMQSNSYIIYKLTGQISQDLSQCYGFHFFDMQKSKWNVEMAAEMGIDINLLPEISVCHDIVGKITPEAANLTGLLEGTPVVAGGLDAACGTLGAGVIDEGQTQEQGGQSGGMSICLDTYKAHPKLIMSSHVVPNKWLLQGGTVGGGGSFKWLKENFFADINFADMDKFAASTPCGADGLIFLPYMAGERSPIWDVKAKGVFFGMDYSKNKGHFIRAVMEGVAYSLQHNIKTAEESGCFIDTMYSIGGSANSDIWMQIKSDVTNTPISVPSSDTSATLGAAILAGVAVGIYTDFHDAVKNTVRIKKTYTPSAENHEVYMKNYKKYLEIYENLKSSMQQG